MGIYTEIKRSSECRARLGIVHLPHGDVETPSFMPVGTNGTVKGIYHDTIRSMGYKLILANTYHIYLRPGLEVLEEYGGLHNLSGLRKIKEEGVTFQSHIDGSKHIFTPEKVVNIQRVIGSDIAMCLDVCTPPRIEYKEAKEAWRITKAWAERSLEERKRLGERFRGNLFGIVQGNFYEDLRRESALTLSEMDFPGIAIGGLSVGESWREFRDMLSYTSQYITEEKPRYVMGIGSPDYILYCVENGIDLFDCVLATRIARNGAVFTDDGLLTLKKALYRMDKGPLQEGCGCTACREYSRGYMHHLIKCNEMLGGMLATEHNLQYLHDFVERIKRAIREDRFEEFKRSYLKRYYDREE